MWKIRDLILLNALKIKDSVLSVFNGGLFFDEQQVPTISGECTPHEPIGINTYGEIVNIGSSHHSEYVVDTENGFIESIGLPEAPFLSIEQAFTFLANRPYNLNVKIKLIGSTHEVSTTYKLPIAGKLTISSDNGASLTFTSEDARIEMIDGGSVEFKNISIATSENINSKTSLVVGDISNMVLISSQVVLSSNVGLYETYMISNLRLIGSTITNDSSTIIDNLGGGITFVSLDEVSSISKSECSSIITHRIQEDDNGCKNLIFSSFD